MNTNSVWYQPHHILPENTTGPSLQSHVLHQSYQSLLCFRINLFRISVSLQIINSVPHVSQQIRDILRKRLIIPLLESTAPMFTLNANKSTSILDNKKETNKTTITFATKQLFIQGRCEAMSLFILRSCSCRRCPFASKGLTSDEDELLLGR